ncbi:MAG: mannonate dehydratase [Acidobacteria bacterium]|nr:mannonate dehydratase [Acidobacteriota bacterium]
MTTRRDLMTGSLAASVAMAAAPKPPKRSVIDEYDPANIKLSHRMPIRGMSDDDLLFLQQIGIRWARIEFGEEASYDYMKATVERLARFNMKIYSAVHPAYRNTDVQLGRPRRDQVIQTYCTFLEDCGRLGIPVSNYDWHPANTYTTAEILSARRYRAREFKLSDFRSKVEKQAFEREYSAEDIWGTYTYFMKAVLPVAEKANVKLALHPDDPPLARMNGVAKLFVHFDGYKRAEQIAGSSRHWGLTFCIGTWSEGGDQMGKDVFEMIRDFGGRGKILDVHFRNVSAPLPHFVETFPDDGYMDMYQVMKALRQVKFNGTAVPDHVPGLAGDSGIRRAGTAYCIACMRSLLRRANEEAG